MREGPRLNPNSCYEIHAKLPVAKPVGMAEGIKATHGLLVYLI